MAFTAIVPAPPLSSAIASIWDCRLPPFAHRYDRILPVPEASLIINLGEDETRGYNEEQGLHCVRHPASVLVGPSTRSFIIDTAEQVAVMGVQFRPGGVLPFFRERVDALGDRHTGIEDLLGARAARLRERLLDAPAPARRLAILEDWLRALAPEPRPQPEVAGALAALTHAPQVAGIAGIVRDSGLSQRRFGALFREHVGMGPKRYARLLRFRAVVAGAYARRRVDWARVAADCGFHDQPHLVHEFRAFSGMTPGAYLAAGGYYDNHVPLIAT